MGDVFTEDVLDSDEMPISNDNAGVLLQDSHLYEQDKNTSAIKAFTHSRRIPSFSEPSKTSIARSVVVIVDRSGPLLMQLKMHPSRKCIMLYGFDRDEDGDKGELELSGKLIPRDLLIDINGKSLERKSFKEVLRIIRQEGLIQGPRVLSFIRFDNIESETDYFGHEDSALYKSSYFARSEVTEDLTAYITELLEEVDIRLPRLRRIAAQGLPPGVRAIVWMILLGYLPCQRAEWEPTLQRNRNLYGNLKTEFRICPTHDDGEGADLLSTVPPADGYDTADNQDHCETSVSEMKNYFAERVKAVDDPLQVDADSSHWAKLVLLYYSSIFLLLLCFL